MTKLQKSLSVALGLTLIMSLTVFHETDAENMLFSGFSLGWSSHIEDNKKSERVEIIDDDTQIVYSFKLAEWISQFFD